MYVYWVCILTVQVLCTVFSKYALVQMFSTFSTLQYVDAMCVFGGVSYPLSSVSGRRPSFWKQFWISLCYWTPLVCPLLMDSPQPPLLARSSLTHFQHWLQASSHGPLPSTVSGSTAAHVPTNSTSDWRRDRIADELNLRALNTFS